MLKGSYILVEKFFKMLSLLFVAYKSYIGQYTKKVRLKYNKV
jgi:hypothetical protein